MSHQEVQEKGKKPFYKKVWFWIVVVIVVIIGVGIGGGDSKEETGKAVNEEKSVGAGDVAGTEAEAEITGSKDVTEDAEDATGKTDITIAEQVLADSDGIKVTATELGESIYGQEMKLKIENNSDVSVMVQSRDVSVNGIMMPISSFSSDVAAGKSANNSITFPKNELKKAGIDTIGEIELKVTACTSDNWTDIFTTDAQQILTSANGSFEQTYDDSGFVAVDQDGYRVIIKKLEDEESFWGADIYVYIENNSDRDVTIQTRDVSINGCMVEPAFSSDVLAGKKAFDSITFLQSDLENNGIEDITNMELYFHIFDKATWSDIINTDIITVNFQ